MEENDQAHRASWNFRRHVGLQSMFFIDIADQFNGFHGNGAFNAFLSRQYGSKCRILLAAFFASGGPNGEFQTIANGDFDGNVSAVRIPHVGKIGLVHLGEKIQVVRHNHGARFQRRL